MPMVRNAPQHVEFAKLISLLNPLQVRDQEGQIYVTERVVLQCRLGTTIEKSNCLQIVFALTLWNYIE